MKAVALFVSLTLGSLLSGCGGGGTSAPESTTTLTNDQATAVSNAIGETISATFESGDVTAKVLKPLVWGKTSAVSVTANCEDGGGATITGTSVNESTSNSASGDVELTVVFDNCKVEGGTVIMDGTLVNEFSFDITDFEPTIGTIDASISGSLDVSGSGVDDGVCGVGIDVSAVLAAEGTSANFDGTICDVEITRNDVDVTTKSAK